MVAMPVNEWRGGAAIRERRKQKEERQGIRKKDGLTRISASCVKGWV